MRYLLDTNIWIQFLNKRNPHLVNRLASHSTGDLAVCSIVRAELLHGARKYSNSPEREARVRKALKPLASLPFDTDTASHYAEIRDRLEREGRIIGNNDLMIAAIARQHQLTLVTNNTKEFERIPDISPDDWSS